ncbi:MULTISPECIES: prolyl oligopeptidase family serine peptidase [Halolamina]|uniref:prolyl oligopeptidase n=1 Tax=Halolamina pelagica TaxID=699431 RepID=A0A1I5MRL6_9EURY|nr:MULTISPECIES: prolyl oligopeptidase family serine peptidase [Halolamina]NHX36132.1 S9 family peptidase [Halolamina sp. R1-12]SFP12224.1 prolyl oligopeptidase [Halolamina pelagica]
MRDSPPDTERRPVTEEHHGEEIVDPYRWLEESSEEVETWVAAQNEYADTVLDTDTRDALRPQFERVARVTDYGAVTAAGGRYFQTIEEPDEDHGVLYVRDSFDEEPRSLVDPNAFDGEAASMNWFTVGPDGERVAYGYDEGGQEQYDVRVVDTDTGELRDEVPDAGRVNPGGFAWTDDGFYSIRTGGPGDGEQLQKALYGHRHDADPDEDELLTDAFSEHAWPELAYDTETDTLLAAVHEGTTHTDLYRVDPDAEEPLTPLLTDYDATFAPHVASDAGEVHFLTNYEADFSRVLTADVGTVAAGADLDPDEFAVSIPETDAVLQDVTVAGESLVANHLRDASSGLSVWAGGETVETLPSPEFCTIDGVDSDDDGEELFYVVHDFEAPDRVTRYRLDGADASPETVGRADIELGVDVSVSQEFFESADGTEVPAFVVHREGLDPAGEAPTVLYGYGGFRIPQTPSFWRFAGPFLDAGGVFVVANLRGGTEYGEPWHEAGMREHKQNVFDDFHAVAEGLIDAGYTDTDHLGAYGGSNGGLLTGAALTQRPDLWAGILCTVPLLDMLRFHRFLLGESWTVEYGSPEDPEAFEYIREYSPYHNVEQRDYPATMFKTAAGDTRVHPSHARKMTALVQAHQTGEEPIVLRTETDTGHGVGKSTEMIVEEQVDQWTWLCDRLGADVSKE